MNDNPHSHFISLKIPPNIPYVKFLYFPHVLLQNYDYHEHHTDEEKETDDSYEEVKIKEKLKSLHNFSQII